MTPEEHLADAIRVAHNRLRHDLHTRKYHPTYGVTKALLWEDFVALRTLLSLADKIKRDVANSSAYLIAEDYNIDLTDLRERVKAA